MLNRAFFQWTCSLGILPDVDLFASWENSQLPKFVFPVLDHLAVAKDAFTQDWNRWEKIYLFSPWTRISRVLNQLLAFKGQAILMASRWPAQAWFQLLQSLAKSFHPSRILA